MGKVMMLRLAWLGTTVKCAFIAGALVAFLPSLSFAENGAPDELQRCAELSDAASRLACYDKLGGRQPTVSVPVDVPAASPAAPAASPAEPVASPAASTPEPVALPPDELGSESLRQKKDKPVLVNAKVIRCTKDATKKKYILYLEGGQVWKVLSDKRLYFKECDFNVVITKDVFGYKMQREGEKSRFRVTRLR